GGGWGGVGRGGEGQGGGAGGRACRGAARAPRQVRRPRRADNGRGGGMRHHGMLAAALMLTIGAGEAWPHAMAPALLEIAEEGGSRLAVTWKTSLFAPTGVTLRPVLPADCVDESA